MGPGPRLPSSRRRWSRSRRWPGRAAAEVRILALRRFADRRLRAARRRGLRAAARGLAGGARRARTSTIVNGGVSGDTSAGGLARIGWALGDDIDAVIVELGANDMLRGIDPA